uniref:Uncharacterized protein n=1 Tax=Knipowitschia caucasica TaxID=637954 RepID=A0AAV2KAR3_KNICA
MVKRATVFANTTTTEYLIVVQLNDLASFRRLLENLSLPYMINGSIQINDITPTTVCSPSNLTDYECRCESGYSWPKEIEDGCAKTLDMCTVVGLKFSPGSTIVESNISTTSPSVDIKVVKLDVINEMIKTFNIITDGKALDFQNKPVLFGRKARLAYIRFSATPRTKECRVGFSEVIECFVQNIYRVTLGNSTALGKRSIDVQIEACPVSFTFTCKATDYPAYVKSLTLEFTQPTQEFDCKSKKWGLGNEGDQTTGECDEGKVGEKVATCLNNIWEEEDNCVIKVIQDLLNQTLDLVNPEQVPDILTHLNNATNELQDNVTESAATIEAIVSIMERLANISLAVSDKSMTEILNISIATMVVREEDKSGYGVHVAFAFFNSLQGFFILLFGTLLDKKVRKEITAKSMTSGATKSTSGGQTGSTSGLFSRARRGYNISSNADSSVTNT